MNPTATVRIIVRTAPRTIFLAEAEDIAPDHYYNPDTVGADAFLDPQTLTSDDGATGFDPALRADGPAWYGFRRPDARCDAVALDLLRAVAPTIAAEILTKGAEPTPDFDNWYDLLQCDARRIFGGTADEHVSQDILWNAIQPILYCLRDGRRLDPIVDETGPLLAVLLDRNPEAFAIVPSDYDPDSPEHVTPEALAALPSPVPHSDALRLAVQASLADDDDTHADLLAQAMDDAREAHMEAMADADREDRRADR